MREQAARSAKCACALPGGEPRARHVLIRDCTSAAWRAVKKRLLVLMSVSSVAFATLGGQLAAHAAATRTVTIKDIAFSPKSLTISKGSKVRFAFRDEDTTHNVVSTTAKRFTSIGNRTTGSPTRTFTRAGTYRYECTLHPGMTGRISVR